MSLEVKTRQCDLYSIRLPNHAGWAVITLDEPTGMVCIHSDYGGWTHHWSHPGECTLREFLTQCDDDYLIGKFNGARTHFNADKTVETLRDYLVDARRRKCLSHNTARRCWDRLKALADDFSNSSTAFLSEMMHDETFNGVFFEPWEYVVREHDPPITMFFERLWPVFVARLREEVLYNGRMKNHLSRARQRVYMTQLLVLGVSFCVGLDLFGRGHVATPLWIAAGFCTFALAYAIHAKRAIQRRVRP